MRRESSATIPNRDRTVTRNNSPGDRKQNICLERGPQCLAIPARSVQFGVDAFYGRTRCESARAMNRRRRGSGARPSSSVVQKPIARPPNGFRAESGLKPRQFGYLVSQERRRTLLYVRLSLIFLTWFLPHTRRCREAIP